MLQSSIQSQPAKLEVHDLQLTLAEVTARRIGWLPSIDKSTSLIPKDLPTDAWADRVVPSIQSNASKFGLDRTRVPAIAWLMRQHFATTQGWYRKVGELGNEHRLVDQLLALARRLTQICPDQAAAYMLLSDGYVQRAKIAYHVEDEPVIGWERQAFDAALRAAALEPENDEARSLVQNRRARLNKLESEQKLLPTPPSVPSRFSSKG